MLLVPLMLLVLVVPLMLLVLQTCKFLPTKLRP
jgi:hypothetical protein